MPRVAIILINYKDYARRFLTECRDSLRQLDYPKEQYQVFIVDNETSSESQKYLAEVYPEAMLLFNQNNAGWGEGNNTAIRWALERGFEDFVLLNMDTVVTPSWLKELVVVANGDDQVGIAQSKILLDSRVRGNDEKEVQIINSLGNLMHYLGFGFCDGYGEPDRETAAKEIGYASGASMLIKKQVFEKVGLFDPELFMYHDDAEISLKARLAGFKIILAPRSVLYHKYEFNRSVRQVYYLERNRFLIIFEMYRLGTILLIWPALLIMELGMWFYALFRGYLKTKVMILGYFLKPATWRHLRSERRRISQYRVTPDREMVKYLVSKIDFQEINNPVLQCLVNPFLNVYWLVVKKLIMW